MNHPGNKSLIRPLMLAAVATALLMASYETIKQMVHVDITIWESHVITIMFTTILAVCVTYVALRKHDALMKILSGFIPICANCRRIRDGKDNWVSVEAYIRTHSEAEFTHGICPECGKQYLEEIRSMKVLK